MTEFEITDEERAYMLRPYTDVEKADVRARKLPPAVAHGWIIQARAHELATRRADTRQERIAEALMKLAEAING